MGIREAEEATDISRQNIRFYEKQGLLHPARNKRNSYREYSDEDILRLKQIRLFRKLGMPLDEIRRLLEGEKNIKLFGEPIEVHARIESLHGVSGHADMNGLLNWIGGFRTPLERVFVVHGEDEVTDEFAKTVEERFGCKTWAPYPCCEADLLTNEIINEGVRIPVKAKKAAQRKADTAFDRLVEAGKRLLDIIYSNEGLSNKDKAKFESQINNLADKWEI